MAISSKSLAVAINERTESFLAFAIELRAIKKAIRFQNPSVFQLKTFLKNLNKRKSKVYNGSATGIIPICGGEKLWIKNSST